MKIKSLKEKSKKLNKMVKMTVQDFLKIQDKANEYTNGNFSAWMRYAALNHRPKKSDLENDEDN